MESWISSFSRQKRANSLSAISTFNFEDFLFLEYLDLRYVPNQSKILRPAKSHPNRSSVISIYFIGICVIPSQYKGFVKQKKCQNQFMAY